MTSVYIDYHVYIDPRIEGKDQSAMLSHQVKANQQCCLIVNHLIWSYTDHQDNHLLIGQFHFWFSNE